MQYVEGIMMHVSKLSQNLSLHIIKCVLIHAWSPHKNTFISGWVTAGQFTEAVCRIILVCFLL